MKNTLEIHVDAITHPGCVREENQDAITVCGSTYPPEYCDLLSINQSISAPSICAVADGLSGHNAGRIASEIVISELNKSSSCLESTDHIQSQLQRVNLELYRQADRNPSLRGMGCTLAGISISPGMVHWFNVGDARVYLFNNNSLVQLSHDDTAYSSEDQRFQLKYLAQSMGGSPEHEDINPHVGRMEIDPNAIYLLCSDGLTDVVLDYEIEEALSKDPATATKKLFNKAMEFGCRDNVSIMTVRLSLETT